MKIVFAYISIFLGIIALGWILNYNDVLSLSFFGPKRAKIERKIFEESPSYVQGKITDLSNYKLQYETVKDDQSKEIIKNVIKEQFSSFNEKNLDDYPRLRSFLDQMLDSQ